MPVPEDLRAFLPGTMMSEKDTQLWNTIRPHVWHELLCYDCSELDGTVGILCVECDRVLFSVRVRPPSDLD